MYARSTTVQAQPDSIDAGIAYFRDEVMPALQDIDGFVGCSMIVDRDTGQCIVTANYASPEARQASAERVMPLRDRAAAVLNAQSVEVAEWEIAGMHRDHRTGDGACVRTTWLRLDPADLDDLCSTLLSCARPDALDRASACLQRFAAVEARGSDRAT